MSGATPIRRHRNLVIAFALAVAAFAAQAQPCTGKLPKPGAMPAGGGEKFALIAQQCSVFGEPARVQRAAQLDLYQGSRSVTIDLSAPQPEAPVAPPAPRTELPPPDTRTARILSLAPALTQAARDNELDPLLLHAIAHVESRHNAQAVSPAGARGVMQVMPATARRFGVTDPETRLFDAETNVRASSALLRTLMKRYDGDLKRVLAAYNAGEGAVDKHGGNVPPYPETQAYVRDVLATYRRLTSEFAVSPTGTLIARGETQ